MKPQGHLAATHLPNSNPWLADSCATHHLTADLDNLAIHNEYNGHDSVTIGNGKTLPISNVGSSIFSVNNHSFKFNDILHVPSASNNLLSVNSFTKNNNVTLELFPDHFDVKDIPTRQVLFSGQSKNGLAVVEKFFDKPIKSFQADWGGEYQALTQYLVQNGINQRNSCPHTPEQNGCAERKHRHIVETGLALMYHASVPLKYWSFAFDAAVYIINRLLTPKLKHKSPYEIIFQDKPNYDSLRTFGCLCYPWLHPYAAHKLAPMSSKCVFLGYSKLHKGYRCLDFSNGKIFISRHVIFDERVFPFAVTSGPMAQSQTSASTIIPLAISRVENQTFPQPKPIQNSAKNIPTPEPTPPPPEPPNLDITTNPITPTKPSKELIPTETIPTAPSSPGLSLIVDLSKYNNPPPQQPANKSTHRMVIRSQIGNLKPKPKPKASLDVASPQTEPTTASQALKIPELRQAMADEYNALLQNGTWELVPRNQAQNVVGCKWVFRIKRKKDGSMERLKARLVAKGFHQRPELITMRHSVRSLGHRPFGLSFPWQFNIVGRLSNSMHHGSGINVLLTNLCNLALLVPKLIPPCLSTTKMALDSTVLMTSLSLVQTPSPSCPQQQLTKHMGNAFLDLTLYRSIVGGLQYLAITRLDNSFSINRVSQYMHDPREDHWSAVKRILWYLVGTSNHGLNITKHSDLTLHAYSDLDWGGFLDDRKSTTGVVVFYGSNLISWNSKKQRTVSRSSTEVEYRALASATTEVYWLQSLLLEIRFPLASKLVLWCDNLSATYLTVTPIFHSRSRHLEIDFHYVRDKVLKKEITVCYLASAN
ncbi:Integrase, catalytic core [Corchorus capsularis]|uniref:Integrase, catalytic core n=1 Tax=Corchorus capsularis TaxID=210143 RepID=A0A1R3GTE8_COCAP|nr:Integrase, catalytic core [Corchorus capsularis]